MFGSIWSHISWQLSSFKLSSLASVSQIEVSCSCVCLVIDPEFRQKIVKVAHTRSTDNLSNVMRNKYTVNNRTDAGKTQFDLFFTIKNCQIVHSRSLRHDRINYKFMCLSAYWQWKLANEEKFCSYCKNWENCHSQQCDTQRRCKSALVSIGNRTQ